MEGGSWFDLIPSLTFTAGALAFAAVALRPAWFWPIVIFANMAGNGPRVNGYLLVDEIITAGAVGGALIRIATTRSRPDVTARRTLHEVVFVLWIGYMVLQSFVGMLVTGDLRIVRWVGFYWLVGLMLPIAVRSAQFPFPPVRRLWFMLLAGTGIAFGTWTAQGLYFEHTLDLGIWGRFDSQDYFWAGGAYAAFPLVLGAPAALILMRDRSPGAVWFACASVFLFMAAGFYFISRITWMVLLEFMGASVGRLGLSRLAVVLLAFVSLFLMLGPSNVEDVVPFFVDLLDTTKTFSDPAESDVSRNLQVKAAFETLGANHWVAAVTGSGIYTHRFLIAPHMRRLQELYIREEYVQTSLLGRGATPLDFTVEAIYRTTAFSALLIDVGIVGLGLLILNLVLIGVHVVRSGVSYRLILLLTVPTVFLWLFVANTTDILLQYLILMPHGLLARLAEPDKNRRVGETAAARPAPGVEANHALQ